eukprot:gb/GECG01014749.1/.p1 GENE.gb/GECG01014749.1/~~gb/GECG01014749.1/.p1  ORF type:complete len:176 (+),score=11.64 gb/GECG01014749.1/:1-528(+)
MDPNGNSLIKELYNLCQQGKLEDMCAILNRMPSLTHVRGEDNTTLIHVAINSPNPVSITRALIRQFEVDCAQPDNTGWLPLHAAAQLVDTSLVELLITEGKSPVDFQDDYGETPLHQAAHENGTSVTHLLCRRFNACTSVKNNVRRSCVCLPDSSTVPSPKEKSDSYRLGILPYI